MLLKRNNSNLLLLRRPMQDTGKYRWTNNQREGGGLGLNGTLKGKIILWVRKSKLTNAFLVCLFDFNFIFYSMCLILLH